MSLKNTSSDKSSTAKSTVESTAKSSSEKKSKKLELLKHPKLWRAGEIATQQSQSRSGIPTGFATLDDLLPDAGWPTASLMELLMPSAGYGELRLLMPAIRALSLSLPRWVAWVNPPFVPYAPALEALGVDINKMLLIHPRSHEDALWALERATKSGSCSLVMAWLDDRQLKLKDTQRLQVAARQGETLTCLFRPQVRSQTMLQPSMAELRVALTDLQDGELTLDIIKRRGGWPVHDLSLPLAEVTQTTRQNPDAIREQLELWRGLRIMPEAESPSTAPLVATKAAKTVAARSEPVLGQVVAH